MVLSDTGLQSTCMVSKCLGHLPRSVWKVTLQVILNQPIPSWVNNRFFMNYTVTHYILLITSHHDVFIFYTSTGLNFRHIPRKNCINNHSLLPQAVLVWWQHDNSHKNSQTTVCQPILGYHRDSQADSGLLFNRICCLNYLGVDAINVANNSQLIKYSNF